jgi:hypothetical protein
MPKDADKTDFYQHDQNWTNRMILGDSLQVMASLAEREGLRGKVQCIYFDPPYGIKFNSNFQWSTTSRDVKDGNAGHITREPEQVKAFRDTWRDGIHSYLTYLRDRLTVARDLLTDSGSIFVQIGDENVHRVRAVMDEVFGEENHHVADRCGQDQLDERIRSYSPARHRITCCGYSKQCQTVQVSESTVPGQGQWASNRIKSTRWSVTLAGRRAPDGSARNAFGHKLHATGSTACVLPARQPDVAAARLEMLTSACSPRARCTCLDPWEGHYWKTK